MRSFNERVCQMFASRFGTQLEIRWSQPVKPAGPADQNWQTTFVYSRTRKQVAFPIFNLKNKLRGIAIASPVDNHDAVRFREMSDFIELTLVESLHNNERVESLYDPDIHIWSVADSVKSKILNLPGIPEGKSSIPSNNGIPENYASQPLWLYGDNPQVNLNVSYAVHEWIKNWAMINAREIPDLFWQKNDPWTSYDQMSILIPGVEELSPNQWGILLDNTQSIAERKGSRPLIILTSQLDPENLQPEGQSLFKTFHTHEKISANAQAHFLLFQHNASQKWLQDSRALQQLFFLPQTDGQDGLQ